MLRGRWPRLRSLIAFADCYTGRRKRNEDQGESRDGDGNVNTMTTTTPSTHLLVPHTGQLPVCSRLPPVLRNHSTRIRLDALVGRSVLPIDIHPLALGSRLVHVHIHASLVLVVPLALLRTPQLRQRDRALLHAARVESRLREVRREIGERPQPRCARQTGPVLQLLLALRFNEVLETAPVLSSFALVVRVELECQTYQSAVKNRSTTRKKVTISSSLS